MQNYFPVKLQLTPQILKKGMTLKHKVICYS